MNAKGRIVAATEAAITEAAAILRAGGLVAFPTETVYGLGADATNDAAIAALYGAKGRPAQNPLIVHVADAAAADTLCEFDERARALAAAFWPGALTLVLPQRRPSPISKLATAGLDTVAVRVPDHPVALALLRAVERPLAAPSANPSGRLSPTAAEHVATGLGAAVDLILDGGPCRVGIESTVIALDGPSPRLLRPGGIPLEAVVRVLAAPVLGPPLAPATPASPGQLPSHYAPRAPLRLNARTAAADEGAITFGEQRLEGAKLSINLSPRGDVGEAAANLYAALRRLDEADVAAIAVVPIPEDGLGAAINDRLRRAAAPR